MIDPISFYNDKENEIWIRFIYLGIEETIYEISNLGNIRNSITKNEMKQYFNGFYNTVGLYINGKTKTFLVHRLVAETFCLERFIDQDQDQVNHINSDPIRNDSFNLEWCTGKENMEHASKYGNLKKGEDSHLSKLSNKQVHMICRLLENDLSYRDIIRQVGLDENDSNNFDLIGNIRRGIAWLHISKQYNIPTTPKTFGKYSDEQIHLICKLLQDGITSKEIAILLNEDMSSRRIRKTFYSILDNIRYRRTYTHISKNYNF